MNGSALGEEFIARVIVVLDGDTVLIRRASGLVKIRLAGIDAPEKAQIFGETSKRSLSGMVKGKQVKIVSETMDQYGRMVAHLSINGLDVNAEQIRRGMAWAAVGWRQSRRAPTGVPLAGEDSNFASLAASRQSLRNPPHSNKALIELQNEARKVPRGLWVQSDPTPPWVWRKLHPSMQPGGVVPAATTRVPDENCGNKKYCSEMDSCDEAKFYLTRCGLKSLDSNGDGTPCESLCAPQEQIKN